MAGTAASSPISHQHGLGHCSLKGLGHSGTRESPAQNSKSGRQMMTSKFAIMRDERRRACEGPSLFLPLAARPSVLGALLGGWGCWPSSQPPRRVHHLVGDCYIHLGCKRVWGSEGAQGWGGGNGREGALECPPATSFISFGAALCLQTQNLHLSAPQTKRWHGGEGCSHLAMSHLCLVVTLGFRPRPSFPSPAARLFQAREGRPRPWRSHHLVMVPSLGRRTR